MHQVSAFYQHPHLPAAFDDYVRIETAGSRRDSRV
jgi:hypothetical protein